MVLRCSPSDYGVIPWRRQATFFRCSVPSPSTHRRGKDPCPRRPPRPAALLPSTGSQVCLLLLPGIVASSEPALAGDVVEFFRDDEILPFKVFRVEGT